MSDIVERLCAVERSEVCETTRTTTNWYRNPDGPEAADEITRLRAEVERLKEFVQSVIYHFNCPVSNDNQAINAIYREAKALQETGDEQR